MWTYLDSRKKNHSPGSPSWPTVAAPPISDSTVSDSKSADGWTLPRRWTIDSVRNAMCWSDSNHLQRLTRKRTWNWNAIHHSQRCRMDHYLWFDCCASFSSWHWIYSCFSSCVFWASDEDSAELVYRTARDGPDWRWAGQMDGFLQGDCAKQSFVDRLECLELRNPIKSNEYMNNSKIYNKHHDGTYQCGICEIGQFLQC